MSERPCAYCPAWEWLNDPATKEGERAIRLEERVRTDRLVARLVHKMELLEAENRRLKAERKNAA